MLQNEERASPLAVIAVVVTAAQESIRAPEQDYRTVNSF
jgi:hypothetical protein